MMTVLALASTVAGCGLHSLAHTPVDRVTMDDLTAARLHPEEWRHV
jgi:hypothetical protein